MSNDEIGYNGWANRETWVVNLWLTNDESAYHGARRVVLEAGPNAEEYLEGYTRELLLDQYDGATMGTDLIATALTHVDWRSIAHGLGEI